MQSISTILPKVEETIESAKSGARAMRAAMIEAGVRDHGWSPDADCPICGDNGRLPHSLRLCDCPAGKAIEIRAASERTRSEWERRWATSGVPRRFRELRLEGAPNRTAAAEVEAWLAGRPWAIGENLVLVGPVGTGKTGLAIGALWRIHELEAVGDLLFVGCSDFLESLRPGGDEGAMTAARRAGILVLDDLGINRGSEWELEKLYALINGRHGDERTTIVTTNIQPAQLSSSLGARTVSRLMEVATLVSVDGPDWRRTGGRR